MALSWSTKKQLKILGILAGLFGVVIVLILYPRFNKLPTCFDKQKNGTETGVDCGGSCQLICPSDASDLVVKWYRSFPVTDTVANAVAYVVNQNSDAGVQYIAYEFRLYDKDHQFITVRTGETFIGGAGPTPIFEGGISVGTRVPVYTTFKFLQNPVWQRIVDTDRAGALKGHDGVFDTVNDKPRLSGIVTNTSALYEMRDITVVGIAYDANGNALGVSETTVDSLPPKASADVHFTWPKPFEGAVVSTEIVPRLAAF